MLNLSQMALKLEMCVCTLCFHLLLNQSQVCSLLCSKARLLTSGCGEGKCGVDCRAPSKEKGQFRLKRPRLLDDFLGRGFEGNVREGTAGCVIISWTIWIDGHQDEVSRSSASSFSQSRACVLWSAVFIWWQSASCKKDLGMCVSSSWLSGNWELGDSVVWLVYRLNYYQLSSQQLFFVSASSHFLVIDCFLSFLFFNWNVIALECCVHLWYTIA